MLADGGVYDNLGLETAWKRYRTILVSDGGGHMGRRREAEARLGAPRAPDQRDHRQPGAQPAQAAGRLRLPAGDRDGAYWGIRSHAGDFGPPAGSLPCPDDATTRLAQTATRLAAMDDTLQERLINWGYAICDIALRKWVDKNAPAPGAFPFPSAGVG